MSSDEWEREKVELEQEVFEIRSQLENSRKQLTEVVKTNGELRQQVEKTESERNERVRQLHNIESTYDVSEYQKVDRKIFFFGHKNVIIFLSFTAEFKRNCESLLLEKSSLSELLDRRSEEIERLQDEIRSLKHENKTLTLQKCEQQLQFDDLNSREALLEHRQNRWTQEKELLLQQKEWFYTELREREQQVQQLRKEMNTKDLDYQTTLDRYEDEATQNRSSINDLREQNVKLNEQCEDLNKKLKQVSDSKASMEEMYEKELLCQTKLVQVYKQSSDEAESKVDELMKALESVQHLFNEAKDSHFTMQEQMKDMENEFNKEIKEKEIVIGDLKDELEKANELLRSKHRVMLSDEEITALSPGAAAASRLIKSGYTLTQIYREHLKAVEELEQQKLENRRLEEYFRELVHDIEIKAPILKQQQEEYFKSLEIIDNLKHQLNSVGRDQDRIISEKDAYLRQLTYTRAELERFQRDNSDLSSQIRELLHCIEKIRRGDYDSLANRSADGNLNSEELFLYRNIDELQATNKRLLSALREAEAKREEMVKAAQDAEMSKVRNELQLALRELEDLKIQREKHEKLLESVSDQRDTYQRLLENQSAKASSGECSMTDVVVGSSEINKNLERLNLEFETYRKQKGEIEKILNEKLEKLQNTLTDSRSANTKLNAEVQYQTERFKILQGNVDSYKKEIKSLRERNEKLSSTVARHEQNVASLTQELLSNREEISKLKIDNNRFQDQTRTAQMNESRLDQELQILRRNSFNQQMLSSTLQELQARLERTEAEQTLKLRLDVENLAKERNNLQEIVKNLNEQSQKYVNEFRSKMDEVVAKLAEETNKCTRFETHLKWTEEQLRLAEEKAKTYENELKTLHSTYEDATIERSQKEAQQLQTRLNYLEIRYTEATKKVEELTQHLQRSENELQQFRRLSDSLESGLGEQKKSNEIVRSTYSTEIAELNQKLTAFQSENEMLREKLANVEHDLTVARSQDSERSSTLNARLKYLETSLADAQQELDSWKRIEHDLRVDLNRESTTCAEYRDKFSREMALNSEYLLELENLRTELLVVNGRLIEAESSLVHVQALAEIDKTNLQDKEGLLATETESLRLKVAELQARNDDLYAQIEKLGNCLSVMERCKTSGNTSDFDLNSSTVSACESESSAALMAVLNSLRQECGQAKDTLDSQEGELLRLKSRENLLLTDIKRLEADLEAAKREASVVVDVMAEKSRLLSKLESLQKVQESNRLLADEKNDLQRRIDELEIQVIAIEEQLVTSIAENQSLTGNYENLEIACNDLRRDTSEWQTRYNELVELRSQFDPEEVNKLRHELAACLSNLESSNIQLKSFIDENALLKSQLTLKTDENVSLESKYQDLVSGYEDLQARFDQNALTLDQARKLGRKYKMQCEEQVQKLKTLDEDLELARVANVSLENEKASLETKLKARSIPEDESSDKKELSAKLEGLSKGLTEMKQALTESGMKLVASQAEKKQLESRIAQLELDKKAVEQTSEEKKFRLDLLTTLHSSMEAKYQKLAQDHQKLSDQYQSDKINWEKQSQDVKAPAQKSISVVSAMPTPATDRPGITGQESRTTVSVRPSRPTRTVVSIPPITTPRSTFAVPPTAVSPSPSFPDQSSSGQISLQGSSVNVTSSSNNQTSSSTVPHAFVSPHIESSLNGDETGGSDHQGSAISSSVIITMEPSTNEAATSSEASASTKRKPSYFESSETSAHKRSRAASPEQVSTSDPSTSGMPMPQVIEHIDLEVEDHSALVGSSLDEDVMILDEPDQSSNGGSDAQVVNVSRNDSNPNRNAWAASVQLAGYLQDLVDDSIVPSTPTLFPPRRIESETGAAHVPQSRPHFVFAGSTTGLDSMMPVSHGHVFGEPAVPSTPRESPPQDDLFSIETEAASSTIAGDMSLPVEQQQPQSSGQAEELENIDLDISNYVTEGSDVTSEAMPADSEEPELGDDDSNEPTTSQPRSNAIRLRRPIVWGQEEEVQGGNDVQSSSGPVRGTRGRANTARRSTRGRPPKRGTGLNRGRGAAP